MYLCITATNYCWFKLNLQITLLSDPLIVWPIKCQKIVQSQVNKPVADFRCPEILYYRLLADKIKPNCFHWLKRTSTHSDSANNEREVTLGLESHAWTFCPVSEEDDRINTMKIRWTELNVSADGVQEFFLLHLSHLSGVQRYFQNTKMWNYQCRLEKICVMHFQKYIQFKMF